MRIGEQEKTRKVRLGVAGLGAGVAMYIFNGKYWPQCEIAAVMDINPQTVRQIQERYHIPNGFTNFEDLIAMKELDAVVICTPPIFHKEQVCAAARAGKHVLCEKPMAPTVAECREMIRCCEENNVYLMIGFMKRFDATMGKVKELITEGAIGPVQQIMTKWTWSEPHYRRGELPWRLCYPLTHGGVFQDHGPHVIDLCRWWLGEVETVSGEINILQEGMEVEDNANVLCRHTSGAVSVHCGSRNCHKNLTEYYLIDGADGSIELYFDNEWSYNTPYPFRLYLYRDGKYREELTVPLAGNIDDEYETRGRYKLEMDYFFDCILNQYAPEINTGYDGLKAVEVVNAVYLSSYLKEKIALPLTQEYENKLELEKIFKMTDQCSPDKRKLIL